MLDFDTVMQRFLGSDYVGISSVTDPQYLTATAFCLPCQAFFNDQVGAGGQFNKSTKDLSLYLSLSPSLSYELYKSSIEKLICRYFEFSLSLSWLLEVSIDFIGRERNVRLD